GDAPCIEPPIALLELERGRLPEFERRRRLDVEMTVEQHGRRPGTVGARGNVADDEIAFAVRHELRFAPGPLDEVAHPLGRASQVVLMRRVRADTRDRDELAQLFEPGLVHGRRVYGTGVWARLAMIVARLRPSGFCSM